MTLKECIEKYGMGEGQKFVEVDDSRMIFEPKFVDVNGVYGGVDNFGNLLIIDRLSKEDWQLYEEPKKKVVRWLWAYNTKPISASWCNTAFFSEDEIEKHKKSYNMYEYIKLEWSRTEFEE